MSQSRYVKGIGKKEAVMTTTRRSHAADPVIFCLCDHEFAVADRAVSTYELRSKGECRRGESLAPFEQMLVVIYHKPFYMLVWQTLLETDMGGGMSWARGKAKKTEKRDMFLGPPLDISHPPFSNHRR